VPWMQELQQLGSPEDVNPGLARRGGKPKTERIKKETSYWMNANMSAPKSANGSSSSAGARTPTPTPTPPPAVALDKGKGREVTPSAGASSPAPRVDKGKAREVIPENPFSPRSEERRMSMAEEILSPEAAAEAQRRRDARAGIGSPRGGPFGTGNTNDPLSNLISMGGGRTVGGASGPSRPGNNDPLSGLLGGMGMGMGGMGMGGMGGMGMGGMGGMGMGGMGGRTASPPPPTSGGRPLGSPIQAVKAPPPTGRAGGRLSGMSGMAGLESLLGGFGGPGGGGLGGLGGGGFDPGMFGPDFFGPRDNKDKSDEGKTGTGTEGGGDDAPRSGTWSGTGIQSNFE